MQQLRRITVGYATRSSRLAMEVRDAQGEVTGEKVRRVIRTCPFLRLCGDWLAQAGFREGDPVKVEVSERCLVITKEGAEEG